MSNINQMVSAINRLGGLSSGNRFVVQITPPASLAKDARTMTFLAYNMSLPGLNVVTEDVKHKGYGLSEKRASGIAMDDIQGTFFVDNSGVSLSFFHKWMQLVSSYDINHANKLVDGMSTETVNYPESYWAEMTIFLKNQAGDDFIVYQLSKLYPIAMSETMLAWDQNDQIATFNITFTYRQFSTKQTADVNTSENTTLTTNELNNILSKSSIKEISSTFGPN